MCSNQHRHPAGPYDDFKILNSSYLLKSGEGNVRILVNGTQIKHIRIDPYCLQDRDIHGDGRLREVLAILPPGSWTSARICPNIGNGELEVVDMSEDSLPRIKDLWHPVRIEYNEFQLDENSDINRNMDVKKAFHQDLGHVILKMYVFNSSNSSFWMKYFQDETDAYKILARHQIGPKFLDHLLEHGRPMGMILEYIPDARFAKLVDLKLCQTELSRLHRIGYKHDDLAPCNLLITNDNKATLIDFCTLIRCEDEGELQAKYASLAEVLAPDAVNTWQYLPSKEDEINNLRWWLDQNIMRRVRGQSVDEEQVGQTLSELEQLLLESKTEIDESKAGADDGTQA